MTLKFRLRGLAETFIEELSCPACGLEGADDQNFTTEYTKVTYEGIIVVARCKGCGEIFVPKTQKLGILNPTELRQAVERDARDSGESLMPTFDAVKANAEKLNAQRKGDLH